MRSALTMLGIVIGVAAVVTMLAVGRGAQERVSEQIRSLGSNVLLLLPGARNASGVRLGASSVQTLTEDDAEAIEREVPEVQTAAALIRVGVQAIGGRGNWATTAYGVGNGFFDVREWSLASGRLFEPGETSGSAKVAIIGQTAARELFGDEDPIDRRIRVRKVPLRIIGVLATKGQSAQGTDQDDALFVPLSTMRNRIQGRGSARLRPVSAMLIKVREASAMRSAEDGIGGLLRQRHRVQAGAADDFSIRNLTEILQAQEASSRVLSYLLAAVAGVSLLVGGIGIMNIMLVSVTERTREIGLRMAVGARGRDILRQFLAEATTLAVIGGLTGVLLGASGAALVASLAGWRTSLSMDAVMLAVGFAAAIGVFFGYYPARKAARLTPIEALRHE
ncbi:MAG: ABC transporter permease [Burkholderiaceae bacterium]|nr:ABC transporter permease [Burkholderiaceae bacterium]